MGESEAERILSRYHDAYKLLPDGSVLFIPESDFQLLSGVLGGCQQLSVSATSIGGKGFHGITISGFDIFPLSRLDASHNG